MKNLALLSLSLAFCIGVAGCGNKTKDPYVVHKVTGTVQYDGKPLEGASVTFFPDGSNAEKMSASSITDAEGKYSLQTQGVEKPGAIAGKYSIAITKIEVKEMTEEERREALLQSSRSGAFPASSSAKQLVPKKYNSPQSSGLTAAVEANDKNVIDFTLD